MQSLALNFNFLFHFVFTHKENYLLTILHMGAAVPKSHIVHFCVSLSYHFLPRSSSTFQYWNILCSTFNFHFLIPLTKKTIYSKRVPCAPSAVVICFIITIFYVSLSTFLFPTHIAPSASVHPVQLCYVLIVFLRFITNCNQWNFLQGKQMIDITVYHSLSKQTKTDLYKHFFKQMLSTSRKKDNIHGVLPVLQTFIV